MLVFLLILSQAFASLTLNDRAFLVQMAGLRNKEAFYKLGCQCLEKGNFTEANYWFEGGARLFHPQSLSALAASYMAGDGVFVDHKRAFRFYKKAADLKDGEGQFNVGIMYLRGIGVKKSRKMALFYLKKASQNKSLGLLQEDAKRIYRETDQKVK